MKNVVEKLLKNQEGFRLTNLDNGNELWVKFVEMPARCGKSFFRLSSSLDNKPKFLQNPKNQIFAFMDKNTNLELDVFEF